jgi:uncharacterized protein (DUF2236 family)
MDMEKGDRLAASSRAALSRPDGGLYGAGSIARRVHANLATLAVGGVAAVILELAEPRIRTGVWEHSDFRRRPLARMRRTAEAARIITFGSAEDGRAAIARINRVHAAVSGVTPEGEPYSANDPELLAWVSVTSGWGFVAAYRRYRDPAFSRLEEDRYWREAAPIARAFGVREPPLSAAAAERAIEAMRPRLRPHPILGEFLQIVERASPLGPLGMPLQGLLVRAAIDVLPPAIRRSLDLPERPLLARAPTRVALSAMALAAEVALGPLVRRARGR